MITFTYHKDTGLTLTSGNVSIAVYPAKPNAAKATLTLLPNPEEEPKENMLSWPGEYEKEGIAIRGIGHKEGGQVSFALEVDGTRCAFLSSPLHDWTDHELELLGNIDVLVLAADDPKLAQKLIDEIDPRVLIPLPNGDETAYQELLKASGAQGKEVEPEFKLKGLPAEGRSVVVLQ